LQFGDGIFAVRNKKVVIVWWLINYKEQMNADEPSLLIGAHGQIQEFLTGGFQMVIISKAN